MRYVPFHPDHMLALRPPAGEEYLAAQRADPDWRLSFWRAGHAMTAVDGRIQASFGVLPVMGQGIGWVWAACDRDIGPRRFFSLTRAVRLHMDTLLGNGYFRLFATVKSGYDRGDRWAKALDMESEGVARKFDGVFDYTIYARVR